MTSRKNVPQDGSNPTMLYGYGGFSISEAPTYRPDVPAFLEHGGIWVTANMRGGGEYGEPGIARACSRRSRTCSTTSSPPPNR